METETIIGPDGLKWTRSGDRTKLICENGSMVVGRPEMTTEYLLSVAYLSESPAEEQTAAQTNEPTESTGIVGTTVNWIKNLF